MEQFKKVFFEECADLLASSETHLSALESEVFNPEDVNAIFRAVHSVKGGAGTFGFDTLVKFAHVFETALDILRSENIDITHEIVDLLLRANDILGALVTNAQTHSHENPAQMDFVQHQLENFIEKREVTNNLPASSNTKTTATEEVKETPGKKLFSIKFQPNLELMRFGNEPYFILRELKKLSGDGHYKATANIDKVPQFSQYNPENCYLSWTIELETEASEAAIRECFEFVEDDCKLTISLKDSSSQKQKGTKNSTKKVKEQKTSSQEEKAPASKEPQIKTSQDSSPVSSAKDISKKSSPPPAETTPVETVNSIRVELDRIDRLVNTVGEMVIKQAMLLDRAQVVQGEHADDRLNGFVKALGELTQHTRELQESVMAIRAQPVKAVFARMPRLVRELSTQLGKDIRIEMLGENTEIDKTVIERLGEPLTHMIRNAVDHGIESPEERSKAGKQPQGHIQLSAEHKSGRIVIQIKDDGKGIKREKILQKAKDQGIVTDDMHLSGEEIDQLIFHPGFSTASQVTNISGRGVGMDVVKKSIQSLGGRVSIHSVEGEGCTFNMLLPLTLAVLDGMIVRVSNECYVVPLINIVETLRPTKNQIHKIVGGSEILDLRSKNIPLVYLHRIFNVSGAVENPEHAIIVVVETEGGEHIGLVVDELLAQQQVVLKSLEANADPIDGISAATILGNGRVSLILDVNALKSIQTQSWEMSHGSSCATGF